MPEFYQKPIFNSLSPNVQKDDLILALKILFQPWKWRQGASLEALEGHFQAFLGVRRAILFNSGRSAFLAILASLNFEKNSEILIPGFTCNATVNPILWSGLKPVFVDIDDSQDSSQGLTLNLDPVDLERKITSQTRAVLVQHTFGLAVNLKEIQKICQKYNLVLIEDSAHCLGAEYGGKKLGSFGWASFFSFGRDKVISSVYGGLAVTDDRVLAKKIEEYRNGLENPSCFWIGQQLLHPLLSEVLIKPLYGFFGLGRWLLLFFQKTKILSKAVHQKEKKGERPQYLPGKMPHALAVLAWHQFKKIDKILLHQREIAEFYDQRLRNMNLILPREDLSRIYMRYPILFKKTDTDEVLRQARKRGLFLNDGWRQTPIVPPDTDFQKIGYQWGSCPRAERAAEKIVNLPTHINLSKKQAEKITEFLEEMVK